MAAISISGVVRDLGRPALFFFFFLRLFIRSVVVVASLARRAGDGKNEQVLVLEKVGENRNVFTRATKKKKKKKCKQMWKSQSLFKIHTPCSVWKLVYNFTGSVDFLSWQSLHGCNVMSNMATKQPGMNNYRSVIQALSDDIMDLCRCALLSILYFVSVQCSSAVLYMTIHYWQCFW